MKKSLLGTTFALLTIPCLLTTSAIGAPPASENPINSALQSLLGTKKLQSSTETEGQLSAAYLQKDTLELKSKTGNKVTIRAIALDPSGRLMVACGGARQFSQEKVDGPATTKITEPGEIRVFDRNLKQVASWSVPLQPQALFVAEDGAVFAAGYESVVTLDDSGQVIAKGTLPHVAELEENPQEIREQLITQIKQQAASIQTYVDQQKKQIEDLLEKPEEERTPLDKSRIQAAEQMMKAYESYLVTDEESLEKKVLAAIGAKRSIVSFAATKEHIFISTRDSAGHGFCIWRADRDFANAKKIVTGLSGCCGNMHIGAGQGELYVAENGRHRVCRYSSDGELISQWGKRDTTGDNGFSSCCNPMNVFISSDGNVYTSESNKGRIKRFSPSGDYQELVGDVELVPGCKNVSIVASPDNSRVYMMDMTRSHIVVMERKPTTEVSAVE